MTFPHFPWESCRADQTHQPFGRSCHRSYIQRAPREVVSVRARLAVKTRTKAFSHGRPVQNSDVLRQDSVQHLYVRELRDGNVFVFTTGVRVLRQRDAQTAAELRGAQVYGDDLGGRKAEVLKHCKVKHTHNISHKYWTHTSEIEKPENTFQN